MCAIPQGDDLPIGGLPARSLREPHSCDQDAAGWTLCRDGRAQAARRRYLDGNTDDARPWQEGKKKNLMMKCSFIKFLRIVKIIIYLRDHYSYTIVNKL